MRLFFLTTALMLSGAARADGGCDTLAGWSADACKSDTAAASTVLGLASTRLAELGDCGAIKKKSDLVACATETSRIASVAVSAGQVLESNKGPKISRSNNNRMESEDTDE